MGHTDTLVVADAGLPIPNGVVRIDLALVPGIPSFLQTVESILTEFKVESALCAEEIMEQEQEYLAAFQSATNYSIEGATLEITSPDTRLVYSPK